MELDDFSNPPPPPPLQDLAVVLDYAARSTDLLSSPDPSQSLAALASLRAAHQLLGSVLHQLDSPPLVADKDEPMREEEEEEEEGSRIIDEVEEGMRECALQTKRRKKRHVSPSWPAGRVGDGGEEVESVVDPGVRRRSAVDLVFQFHA